MEYQVINWERYPRRAHFEYFSSMADPYAGVTAEVDVTRFLSVCKGAGLPFFSASCTAPDGRPTLCPSFASAFWTAGQ